MSHFVQVAVAAVGQVAGGVIVAAVDDRGRTWRLNEEGTTWQPLPRHPEALDTTPTAVRWDRGGSPEPDRG